VTTPRNPEHTLDGVSQEAETRLRGIDPAPFSTAAFEALTARISQYMKELVNESIKVSKRHRADTVSAAHVERASEYLVSSAGRRFFRHVGTLGGILLGASLSNLMAMSVQAQYTGMGTMLSAGLGIVGAFMIALHIARD
jgi:hypothetical protein